MEILSSRIYGLDEDGLLPSAELQHVVIPRSSIILDDAQFSALQAIVDPLADSDNYGIELYEQARSHIRHMLSTISLS